MTTFDLALGAHVAAGFLALSVFWIPLVTKKGGPAHRRVGFVYVFAMLLLSATALVVCALRIAEGRPERIARALFFAYVAVIASSSALAGVRALRPRVGWVRAADVALFLALAVGGALLGAWGARAGVLLYAGFGALGLALGALRVRFFVRPPVTHAERVLDHMNGMGVACIATLTAFLVLNAPRLGLGTFNVVVWFAPPVVGGIALALAKGAYARKRPRYREGT
jgi:hypothetical protein